jgi:nucleoside-diphosphate-sugar epimerase
MRAFITGGTGFIGRHLIADLLAHGYEVTALVRTFERARRLPRGVRTVPGDITKRDTLLPGLRGAEVVFHVAAANLIGVNAKEAERLARINIDGTRHVLETAAEFGVPKIVYTSTVAVYGDTRGQAVDETYRADGHSFESEYERTKYLAHYEVAEPLQQRGAPVVMVCPGLVYGPGDDSQWARVLRAYARKQLPAMVGPSNALTWAHVADVATGHRLAAEKGRVGETYILAGPAHTYREFFAVCARVSRIPAPRVWLPAASAEAMARVMQKFNPALTELLRSVAGLSYLARADKAQRELGWQARRVEEGLPETIEWLLNSN